MPVLLYFVASAASLIAAALCFRANQPYRGAIDGCLGQDLIVPERVFPFYDAAYLNKFISAAKDSSTPLGKSALDLYVRPVLLWIDVGFAIFYAGFIVCFWLALLNSLAGHGLLERAFQFLLTMGAAYGVADVVEDLWLVRLFSKRSPVSRFEGLLACALTLTKLVTIALSLIGGVVFWILNRAFPKPNS
jgi:hypothetical protein